MPTIPHTTETRRFELENEAEPGRIVRGCIESPAGAERAEAPLPFVLVLHGFKGFMDWGFFPFLSRCVAGAGCVAIRFNMSGSGIGPDLETFTDDEGFARNTPTRELEDVETVRGFALSGALPWVDPERGAILGHSLGGAVALLHAARYHDYRAVVTWSAVSTFRRNDAETERLWRETGFVEIENARSGQKHRLDVSWLDDLERNAAALDVPAACARLRTPALLVHGADDASVPYSECERLLGAFAPGVADHVRVEGAGHTFGATHPFEGPTPALEQALDRSLEALERALRR